MSSATLRAHVRKVREVLLLLLLLSLAESGLAALYTVADLGVLSDAAGRSESRPNDLNAAGRIAGANALGGAYRALLHDGSWKDLGTLGGNEGIASGLNDAGRVVGQSHLANGFHRAFLWTPGGQDGVSGNPQMKDMGTLGGSESEAYSINNNGQIAGFAQTTKNEHAFLYSGGQMTDIGALMKGLPNSFGYSVNSSGHVAGTAYSGNYSTPHAFLYNGFAAIDIGNLGGGDASALALNDQDQVVGYATTAAGFDHAFRYANGVMSDLGTLGGNYSYALAINNGGVAVGGSFIDQADLVYHAFITAGSVLVDLNTQLDSTGAGWTIIEARTINDANQIAGVGTFHGVSHGFLLTPSVAPPQPRITTQPTDQTASCGGVAQFSLTATPQPLACQWYKGNPPGAVLAGATNSSLSFSSVKLSDGARYYAVLTNASGSVTSSVVTLTVSDTIAPVISGCPADQTVYIEPTQSTAVVSWPAPTANDNCSGVVPVTAVPASGSTFNLGQTTVRCVANDASGNTNSCSFVVNVLRKPVPVITTQPTDQTASCGGSAQFSLTATPQPLACQWYKGNPPGAALAGATNSSLSFSSVKLSDGARYYAVLTNASGSVTSSVVTLTVSDTIAPVISGCPGDQTVYIEPAQSTAVVSWPAPTANDNCAGVVPVTAVPASGSTFNLGQTTVRCAANDASGNTNSCSFIVNVLRKPVPVITAQPTDQTATCGGSAQFSLTATPLPLACQWYKGNPPGAVLAGATNSSLSFSSVKLSDGARYYAVLTNTFGSVTSSVVTLTVSDTIAPVISGCPGDQTVYIEPAQSTAVVSWPAPTANDNCAGVVPVTAVPASGSTFNLGQTTVRCLANDASGNTNSCSFVVNVLRKPVPVITTQPTDQTASCGGSAQFSLTATPQPLACQWHKGNPPGAVLAGATNNSLSFSSVKLSDGARYYAVLTNASGSVTSSVVTLTVSDTTAPVISGCPADLTVYIEPAQSAAVVSWPAPTANDNCAGVVPVTAVPASGSTFDLGQTTVRCVANDASGNTNSCSFVVNVLRKPVPVITTQPTDQTASCGGSAQFSLTATPLPLSCQWYKGNPPGAVLAGATNSSLSFSSVKLSDGARYYAVLTNAAGSVTSSVVTLTVSDTTAPVLSGCPGDQTVYIEPAQSTAVVSWPAPTANDNCFGVVPVTAVPASGSTFNLGQTTVRCLANDASGNTNSCSFVVNVLRKPALAITAVRLSGQNIVIGFTSAMDATYAIEGYQGVPNFGWSGLINNIPGTGGIVEVMVPRSADVSWQFLRVRQMSP